MSASVSFPRFCPDREGLLLKGATFLIRGARRRTRTSCLLRLKAASENLMDFSDLNHRTDRSIFVFLERDSITSRKIIRNILREWFFTPERNEALLPTVNFYIQRLKKNKLQDIGHLGVSERLKPTLTPICFFGIFQDILHSKMIPND